MTRIELEDPSEGATWKGYHTLRVEHAGDLLVEAHVSPDVVDDLSDSLDMDLPELYRLLADLLEEIERDEPQEYGPPGDDGAGDLFG